MNIFLKFRDKIICIFLIILIYEKVVAPDSFRKYEVLSNKVNKTQDLFQRKLNFNKHVIYPIVIASKFEQNITVEVNRTTEYIFEYLYNKSFIKNGALRVMVNCPSSIYTYPVLVVVRQQRSVLSWQLPMEPPPYMSPVLVPLQYQYKKISHTLCPVANARRGVSEPADLKQRLFVDVTTSSPVSLNFTVRVNHLYDFIIRMGERRELHIFPGESIFLLFRFSEGVQMVLVKTESPDNICAMISIQNVSCPVYDREETMHFANFYQTMTTRAGITVQKSDFPLGFYVTTAALSSDSLCAPRLEHFYLHRHKKLSIVVEEALSARQYAAAIFAGLGFCAFFYIVAMLLACTEYIREKKALRRAQAAPSESSSFVDESALPCDVGERSNDASTSQWKASRAEAAAEEEDECEVAHDYDTLDDAERDIDVFRRKAALRVSDLTRQDAFVLRRRSFVFVLGLLTVVVFYAVPVVQLVVANQKVLYETGNLDLCFYNFWCAHPLGSLSDFNHMFSNVGYVLFGILFIVLCYRRARRRRRDARKDPRLEKRGIPHHFGLFYAMGGALIAEGVLSACYHVCPNYSNFQFDTAFMYVIAVLCMLNIYQTRHPDVAASSHAAYLSLAAAVLIGVVGVMSGGSRIFWVVFAVAHMAVCIALSTGVYYVGRCSWRRDLGLLVMGGGTAWCRALLGRGASSWRVVAAHLRPAYCDRMTLLLVGNAANWALAIYGAVATPTNFASHLLFIFMLNLILYMAFYIIMKWRHGERLHLQPRIYLVLCACAWALAAYFFLRRTTTWAGTAAHSRQLNRACELMSFYDAHDVWHFLSAAAMFFGFMLLLTLDNDLITTSHEQIPVF